MVLSFPALVSGCGGDGGQKYEFPDPPVNPEKPEEPADEAFKSVELPAYPDGLSVFSFTETFGDGKQCSGFYAVTDLKANTKLKFNTVLSAPAKTPSAIFESYEAEGRGAPQVAVNGGFFWSGASLSLLVADEVVKSIENQSVSRTGANGGAVTVYPLRSAFGQMSDGTFEAHWIYCVASDGNRPYAFSSPLGNNEKTKEFMPSPPDPATWNGVLWSPKNAIGGGPRLVKDGANVAVSSYWGECLEEGGIAGTSRQPRTAVGATADNKIILLVCDGRSMNGSSGYTLSEMADRLAALGAVTAVNLDGGGSSAFVGKDGKVLNRPSDTGSSETIVERKVPTAIVITLSE